MIIKNGTVFLENEFVKKDIRIADGIFADIAEPGKLQPTPEEEIVDAFGKYVLPGLVDIHSHGRIGEDFSTVTVESLERLCTSYAECGVTAVLATTMTNPKNEVESSMEAIGEYRKEFHKGAKLLGVHMEGPFLGRDKKGAHDEQYLTAPEKEWFDLVHKLSGNGVRLITVDPTLDGAEAFITYCTENNIKVSLGHTSCNYEQAKAASGWGADHVTHCFNAMNSLHHRDPGLIGAAMDSAMYTELICDGIHLHPAIIRMMFAINPEKQLLISDSMQAAGLPDGEYTLGGLPVFVKEGKATQSNGTIAGSTISVFDAMRNAIRFGIPKEQAVLSAGYLPAKSVGIEDKVGSILVGRAADALIVSEAWELERVLIDGEEVKNREEE